MTGYHHVVGAKENAFPFWTQADAIALDKHLRHCLQTAIQTDNLEQRHQLLTAVIVGGGASGVEMAATLADFLPHWYSALGGNAAEVRLILLNHGKEILTGDINDSLRSIAEIELQKRTVKIEIIPQAEVIAVHPQAVEYQSHNQVKTLSTSTTIWTAGTANHPLIQDLPISPAHRDNHGCPLVTPTM